MVLKKQFPVVGGVLLGLAILIGVTFLIAGLEKLAGNGPILRQSTKELIACAVFFPLYQFYVSQRFSRRFQLGMASVFGVYVIYFVLRYYNVISGYYIPI